MYNTNYELQKCFQNTDFIYFIQAGTQDTSSTCNLFSLNKNEHILFSLLHSLEEYKGSLVELDLKAIQSSTWLSYAAAQARVKLQELSWEIMPLFSSQAPLACFAWNTSHICESGTSKGEAARDKQENASFFMPLTPLACFALQHSSWLGLCSCHNERQPAVVYVITINNFLQYAHRDIKRSVNGINVHEAEKVHLAVSCKLAHKRTLYSYVISINLCLIVRFKIVFRTFVLVASHAGAKPLLA